MTDSQREPVTVTISDDPRSLGCEATAADLETYRGRLETYLNNDSELNYDFGPFQIEVKTGSVYDSTATHPAVENRVSEIEGGDEWLGLLADLNS
jgi:hypothetical protein